LARRAFNHWPKLEQPAKVGGVRFSAGVSSRLVVEAAQRLYEFESTPEKEAERIERLQAFREQLDPLNLAPHAEAFNEAPDEALRPEQAEAERPEVVGYRIMRAQADKIYQRVDKAAAEYEAGRSALGYMEDIAEAALCLRNRLDDLLAAAPTQAQHSVPEISGIGRDAEHPRAVVLYLRNEPSEEDMRAIQNFLRAISADVLTQAQHSAGYAEARQCVNCRHIGINDAADYAACHDCRWTGPEPDEDKCPGCAGENCMAAACPECGGRYELVAEAKISTPAAQAGQVPEECAPGTYAIDYLDNWDGEGDRYFCIAEKTADGKWIRQESGQELLEYKGDAILAAWLLAASEAQERDK
ncbi:hypothetical protein L4Z34_006195, partial [Pseudomonas aeruginosa]|nr:hypothetical protein [Pseudomonas aeruginosa]